MPVIPFRRFLMTVPVAVFLLAPQLAASQETTSISANVASDDSALDRSKADRDFAEKFWKYLISNNYKHWSPAPGKSTGFFSPNQQANDSSESVHTSLSKLYLNRKAMSDSMNPPMGSIVVLENYRADRSLKSISVMYRSEGYHPEANDWFWAQYRPDGSIIDLKNNVQSVSSDRDQTGLAGVVSERQHLLIGRSATCIECHRQSGQSALTFFNDDRKRDRIATMIDAQ